MAVLFCGGGGNPQPSVTWHRIVPAPGVLHQGDTEQVLADGRVLLSESFVLFTEVELSDEGFYFCTLNSSLGTLTSKKALLNVYSEEYTDSHYFPF